MTGTQPVFVTAPQSLEMTSSNRAEGNRRRGRRPLRGATVFANCYEFAPVNIRSASRYRSEKHPWGQLVRHLPDRAGYINPIGDL